jgi:hypothetical protein
VPRHLVARGLARLWLLVLLVNLPILDVTASAQSRRAGRDGVTVFTDPDYRGTSGRFVDDIADLRDFGLNDVISSIDIRPGEVWEVCRDINFANRCEVLTRSVSNLSALGWDDRISSLRRLEGPDLSTRGTTGSDGVTVFTEPNYRGTSETIVGDSADLRDLGLNDQISSVDIPRGEVWEVCQDVNFVNRCQTLTRSVADLGELGWNDRISSMRRLDDSVPGATLAGTIAHT